ncbi:MAG: dATP pyrophosphohydrolase [Pseudomonadota bacterium]
MVMSMLTIDPVTTPKERRAFARMTVDLYKDDPNFVQPLDYEFLARLNPQSNPLLANSPHQLWLARRGGRVVGRIGAIINRNYQDHYGKSAGHFGYFEAIDDRAVIDQLFDTAAQWLRARHMVEMAGPYNFSVNEECGLLVEGFDRPPAVMMPHGKPYYAPALEAMGFTKASDMFALWYPARYGFMPEKRQAFVDKVVNRPKVEVRSFDFANFESEILTAVEIFNDAWANNWGFVPLSEAEARHMASELRPIITRYNTVMCSVDGEPSAFGIVLPNINEVIGGFDGKLLPFNWAKFLWWLKVQKPKTARMPLMGIRQKLQGKPLGAAFAFKIIEMVNNSSVDHGIVNAELSWILESNKPMIAMLEDIGAVIDKRYRIYEKPLVAA